MAISVFLSRPTPHEEGQREFLDSVEAELKVSGLTHRTIGHTDYGPNPMSHIRGVMMDCNGFLGVAFRRFRIDRGVDRPWTDVEERPRTRDHDEASVIRPSERMRKEQWLTSPYLHIEAATAYAIGLPVFLIIEEGVIMEGALERGILANDAPVFNSSTQAARQAFFEEAKWRQLLRRWEGNVREVVFTKGQPPQLYNHDN